MNWWDLIREASNTFLVQHGVLAAFVYIALEESGIPIPVPGDFLMLALGVRAREGSIVLWQVIVAMEAGTVVGSSLLLEDTTHVAPVALFTEAVRQAFFGLILGLTYPVLRARHATDLSPKVCTQPADGAAAAGARRLIQQTRPS
jgi:hypothetical protein